MKTVLLIEDDKKITLALGVRLKSMGYEVASAADAVTAVAQARKTAPDVILIDINLPGGDGFMVAKRLQNLVQSAATPIIFITASKQPGLRERAKELGAVAFLEKPFDATQLADAIEMSLYSAHPIGEEVVG
jgi:CheY-like chemotaxis protein